MITFLTPWYELDTTLACSPSVGGNLIISIVEVAGAKLTCADRS